MIIRLHGLALLPASARRPRAITEACRLTLRGERAGKAGELNIIFVQRARMLALNRDFLKHDHDTDVIAFRYEKAAGKQSPFGDVYVSAYQARIQADRLGHAVLKEVLTLVIHGTLHLLGYDDRTPGKKKEMFRAQDRLLARL